MNKFLVVLSLFGLAACSSNFDKSLVSANSDFSIINGTNVEQNDPIAKVTVGIWAQTKDAEGNIQTFKCTGLIYNENTILTAAHCIPTAPKGGAKAAVIVFDTDIDFSKLNKANARHATKMVAHPKWVKAEEKAVAEKEKAKEKSVSKPKTAPAKGPRILPGFYDIGVIQFEGGLPEGYHPAEMATSEVIGKVGQETEVVVSGFGLIDDKTQSNTSLLHKGHSKIIGLNGRTELITDQTDRNGICQGDSGGPAFFVVDGKPYAWGIASRVANPQEGQEDLPCSGIGVHGLIDENLDFVDSVLKQLESSQK